MAPTHQKKALHAILASKLNNLTIPSSSSSPLTDFDFSDVFGPPTPSSTSCSLTQQGLPGSLPFAKEPEVIHNRSHSFVGPSPRFALSECRTFNSSQSEGDEDEDGEDEVDDLRIDDVDEGKEEVSRKIGPNDFEILRVVGQGAFGKVFQVISKKGNDGGIAGDGIFAMKVMRKEPIIKKNHVDYMRAERDILTKVVHPFIVQLRYSFQVMLTDFGLAKEITESSRSNSLCGTTEYMAPEILQSKGHNKDADWWSIGILLYEMLTGQVPFTHKNRQKLQQRIIQEKVKLPPFLTGEAHSLLKGFLQKDPSKRLGSGANGSEEVKRHKWFRSINWKTLEAREVQPMFKPDVNGKECTANFDNCWTAMQPHDSPAATPTAGEHFQGYTYVEPNPWLSSI